MARVPRVANKSLAFGSSCSEHRAPRQCHQAPPFPWNKSTGYTVRVDIKRVRFNRFILRQPDGHPTLLPDKGIQPPELSKIQGISG